MPSKDTRTEFTCDHCGKGFLSRPCWRPGPLFYCSSLCANRHRHIAKPEIPNRVALCECGCGQRTPIANRTNARLGHRVGYPVRFVIGHHTRLIHTKEVELTYEVIPETGCWEWDGAIGKSGYGTVRANGKTVNVHRFAYEQVNGPLPEHWHLHHECQNRRCICPDHLTPLEPAEHIRLHVNLRQVKTAA